MDDGVASAKRIHIQGCSGSGKTTLARRIASARQVPRLELDALYHQANWTPLDDEEFRSRVRHFVAHDEWVIDGNYSVVRDLVWARADLVVLVDLPRWRVMSRVLRRTGRRLVGHHELWNGNRESWRNVFSRDPMKNIVLWTWRRHGHYHTQLHLDLRAAGLPFAVRVLNTPREMEAFARAVCAS